MEERSISVLMSVYKSESPDFLSRALQSVWTDQLIKPHQIVLVQDGPIPDGLQTVIKQWESQLGEKLRVVKNEENLGLTKSLNRGLQYVTSAYIARMDSDDISVPNRFQLQMAFLQSHPHIDVVGGAIQEFEVEAELGKIRFYPEDNDHILRSIHKASPLAHPAVMIRRSIFEGGIRYNEKYRTSQDLALWFDILCANKQIANISEVVLLFRRNQNVLYRRAKYANVKNEFDIYIKGIYRLHGLFTLKYLYPVARFCFRLMPVKVVTMIYNSKIRQILIKSPKHVH